MPFKITSTLFISFLLVQIGIAQDERSFLGGGESDGITVNTSSNSQLYDGVFKALGSKTIDGFGLVVKQMKSVRFLAQATFGGNAMVMEGNVNGGNIYGTYPTLEVGGPDYLNGGIMVPTTPVDSMSAELALWYGLDPGDLTTIFPNLGNFHTVADLSTDVPPLGFMNM